MKIIKMVKTENQTKIYKLWQKVYILSYRVYIFVKENFHIIYKNVI